MFQRHEGSIQGDFRENKKTKESKVDEKWKARVMLYRE